MGGQVDSLPASERQHIILHTRYVEQQRETMRLPEAGTSYVMRTVVACLENYGLCGLHSSHTCLLDKSP